MANAVIFLDESGDLGWKFDQPYRNGGSSRYLTIAALCCPSEKQHIPARLIRDLYKVRGWNPKVEKKWTRMQQAERAEFAHQFRAMLVRHPDITAHGVVVRKQNVQDHIRQDPNKLYNYLIACCLLKKLVRYDEVTLVPDPRSVKVASGNALPDYLQMKLWFDARSRTRLIAKPRNSSESTQVQCADMLAGLIQSRYEDGDVGDFAVISKSLQMTYRFF